MDLLQMRIDAVDRAAGILTHYPGPIMIACAIVGTAVVGYYAQRWVDKRKPRADEAEMKRRAQLDQMYADKFGDALFDMLMRGEISRHEYRRDCKRFGIAYRLSDLLTKKNPKRGMKYRIEKNCAEIHSTPHVAGKIPGPKPGEDIKIAVFTVKKPATRKMWLVSADKLRRKSA